MIFLDVKTWGFDDGEPRAMLINLRAVDNVFIMAVPDEDDRFALVASMGRIDIELFRSSIDDCRNALGYIKKSIMTGQVPRRDKVIHLDERSITGKGEYDDGTDTDQGQGGTAAEREQVGMGPGDTGPVR